MARSERAGRVAVGAVGVRAAGALGLGVSLVACNALLGLSDFDKIECANFECPDDAGDAGPIVKEAGADAADAGDAGPVTPGAPPAVWANWPMPSWEGGIAPVPDYKTTATPNEILEDTTGLVWWKAEIGAFGFEDAKQKCAALANGPWRLPKRIELVTLVDPTRGGTPPMISPRFEAKKAPYWTSSEVRPVTTPKRYWVVDFTPPEINAQVKLVGIEAADTSAAVFVRCVKDKS
jgi:hypothetical protein